MAHFMPADCEELERVDDDSGAGDVPEGEDDDYVYDNLWA